MPIKDIQLRSGDKLPIKQFKLESMVENPAIVMIAKKGSGKSWIVRDIMYHIKDIPMGIVIAPTDRMNGFYSEYFPESYIHYKYKSETLQKLLARQEEMVDKMKEKKKRGKKVDPRAYIIMDDCLADKKAWVNDDLMKELLYNGRHYQLMYILTMQTPLGISPDLRGNFDYIFVLAEDFISNQKKIYEHYAGMFVNFDSFRQVFNRLTENFGAMVILNRGQRANPLEKICWFKADERKGKINFGCKQFRTFHEKNFDPDWKRRSKEKTLDFDQFCRNKKQSKSTIEIEKEEVDDKGNVIDAKKKSTIRNNYEYNKKNGGH